MAGHCCQEGLCTRSALTLCGVPTLQVLPALGSWYPGPSASARPYREFGEMPWALLSSAGVVCPWGRKARRAGAGTGGSAWVPDTAGGTQFISVQQRVPSSSEGWAPQPLTRHTQIQPGKNAQRNPIPGTQRGQRAAHRPTDADAHRHTQAQPDPRGVWAPRDSTWEHCRPAGPDSAAATPPAQPLGPQQANP